MRKLTITAKHENNGNIVKRACKFRNVLSFRDVEILSALIIFEYY